ncbi:MFS general substrate transporter [Meredithblackwellia eburnea MCA 4105]
MGLPSHSPSPHPPSLLSNSIKSNNSDSSLLPMPSTRDNISDSNTIDHKLSPSHSVDKIGLEHVDMSDREKHNAADPSSGHGGELASGGPVDRFGGELIRSDAEKRLVRKLDTRIMPIIWALYFWNYVDRNGIAQARLNGLEKSLHLQGNQFNICVSILFVGYTIFQVPSNMIMSTHKVRPSVWMSCWAMIWAINSACTALAKDFKGLFVVRFMLGITECPLYPGAIYLLSLFYPRRELAARIGILYSANIVATATAGLIAAATFSTLDHKHGLRGFQWLFIIEGVVTFAIAILALFLLPDHPLTTRWLTPDERLLAQARMDRDTVGLEPSKGAVHGLKQAIYDRKLWLLTLMQTLHLASCGFNSFFPTVLSALKFNTTITLVLQTPPYLTAGFVAVVFGITSGKLNERTWHITASMITAIIGFVISCTTLQVAPRYFSCFLFAIGSYSANSIILGWVTATCGQTQEKKAAALSIVNMFANASFAYTPFLYPKSDGPKYLMAMSANAAFAFGTLVCAWGLKVWLQAENRRIRASGDASKLLYAF